MQKIIAASVALLISSTSAVTLTSSYRPPDGTVPWHKEAEKPDQERDGYPRNYFVPNFGEDSEVVSTLKSMEQAEKQLNHKWTESDKPDDPPRNYFVPHFGTDADIKNTFASASLAE